MSPEPVVHWAVGEDDDGWFLMVSISREPWITSGARFETQDQARAFCDHVAGLVSIILEAVGGIEAVPITWTN